MPVRNNFGPSKNTVEKETPKENAKKLSQLRVFGIADREHLDSLAWFLDTPDINCMGVLPPRSSVQSVEDTVDKVAAMPIDVLVLLASVFDNDFQTFMQEYGKNRSGVASVLVTDSTIDVDLLQAAMASGINNVVYATDLDKSKVCDVIWKEASKNLSRNESAEVLSYSSRVVLTYSSKGGVGKTTVAVNLASALTQRGKKVVVVDLDLASGDVHSFLGVNNAESIAELAEEPQPITPTTIKAYVHPSSSKIGVVCAPSAPQHASVVKPDLISKVITTLRSENDYVIIDCDQQLVDGNIAACNSEAMKAADLILFIVTPEVPTINGAYDMIHKYLNRSQGIADKIRLVVNKAGSASTITGSEIANTLGQPVFASIPDDYGTVVQTLNTGVPFMTTASVNKTPALFRRPIVKAYEALTEKVVKAC
jgi:pilus assembly protein CpaE